MLNQNNTIHSNKRGFTFLRGFNSLNTILKLVTSFGGIILIQIVMVFLAYTQMKAINNNISRIYSENLLPIQYLDETKSQLYKLRGDIFKYVSIPAERSQVKKDIRQDMTLIDYNWDKYKNALPKNTEALAQFDSAWIEYRQEMNTVQELVETDKLEAALNNLQGNGKAATARKNIEDIIEQLTVLNQTEATQLNQLSNTTFTQAIATMLIALVVAIALSFLSAALITNSFNRPLKFMAITMQNMAVGNIYNDKNQSEKDNFARREDEIGAACKGLVNMQAYISEMVEAANHIAHGDLTLDLTLKSEADQLGMAFQKMLQGLRQQINSLAKNAEKLSAASQQLAASATQSGQATAQITTTLQQIALGTSKQAENITTTATSVEQMSNAIDGVAQGASEQAKAVTKASSHTAQLNMAIQQVSNNVQKVMTNSAQAAKSANEGAAIVQETLEGMENIKTKVGFSAEKVREMGDHSNQIGLIVETIEDIASQTNMLALNAAIEAARAGDYGKGFAVVADEVRKLAERSSEATKDISNLVKDILTTVSEAIATMQDSTQEVEKGVTRANMTGQSYTAILELIEDVHKQAESAGQASEIMMKSAEELISDMDMVSAVVEENTAATEEMAAGSNEVTLIIENIASISEENTAAIEGISATAEEMNAQVEEVTTSAYLLAEMADSLNQIVTEFKLPERALYQDLA
jgi:methyl-accepting chemotaxis protein